MLTILALLFKVSVILGIAVTIIVVVGTVISAILSLIGGFITAIFLFFNNFFIERK